MGTVATMIIGWATIFAKTPKAAVPQVRHLFAWALWAFLWKYAPIAKASGKTVGICAVRFSPGAGLL